jgi:hypothetical protein
MTIECITTRPSNLIFYANHPYATRSFNLLALLSTSLAPFSTTLRPCALLLVLAAVSLVALRPEVLRLCQVVAVLSSVRCVTSDSLIGPEDISILATFR